MVRYFINTASPKNSEAYHEVLRVGQPEGWASYLGTFTTYDHAKQCVEAYIDWQGGVLDNPEDEYDGMDLED